MPGNSAEQSRRRVRRAFQGICILCGKHPARLKRKHCVACADLINKKMREYYEKRFFYRRAGGTSLGGDRVVTAKILAFLWKKQKGLCALTGQRLTRLNSEVDHIIPFSKGGEVSKENLRWVLKSVNRAKQTMTDAELITLCKQIVEFNEAKN
jgi:5-methylcytosine-specific restriction endonuclease McrA